MKTSEEKDQNTRSWIIIQSYFGRFLDIWDVSEIWEMVGRCKNPAKYL